MSARTAVGVDQLDDLVMAAAGEAPAVHARLAARIEALARTPHEDDEVAPSELWVHVSEQRAMAQDVPGALAAAREAVAAPEADWLAPCTLLSALEAAGERAEADELIAAMRRERGLEPDALAWVGGVLEDRPDLPAAHAWYTRSLVLLERAMAVAEQAGEEASTDDEVVLRQLLMGRYRVRRAMDQPLDGDDEAALDVLEEEGAEEDEDATGDEAWGEDGWDPALGPDPRLP